MMIMNILDNIKQRIKYMTNVEKLIIHFNYIYSEKKFIMYNQEYQVTYNEFLELLAKFKSFGYKVKLPCMWSLRNDIHGKLIINQNKHSVEYH